MTQNWNSISLGECGHLYCGQSLTAADVNLDGRGYPYFTGPEQWDGQKLHVNKWSEHAKRFVPHGCIFITVKGAGVGRIFPGAAGAIGRDIYAFQVHEELNFTYVLHALEFTVDTVVGQAKGDIPGLSKHHILDHKIVLPGVVQQGRIVAKLEELFSELDKGVESLIIAREQLRGYRQSVLKNAFKGGLTEGWRRRRKEGTPPSKLIDEIENASSSYFAEQMSRWQIALQQWERDGKKGKRPSKPERPAIVAPISDTDIADLPSIPESWAYVRLATLAQIGSGMSVSKERVLDDPVEMPYLRVANVQRGGIDLSHIVKMRVERSRLPQLVLKKWDVLFNEGGDRDKLGRGWVWEDQINPCITQNHVFRASPYIASEPHAKFISYWGNTFGQDYFNTEGKQTTNLASINKAVLSSFPVPLPSMQEQREIVSEIEERLSLADGLLSEIHAALKHEKVLRHSILKRAFSGELVAQDPRDEPASAVLERIRAERESGGKTKERTGKNGRKKAA